MSPPCDVTTPSRSGASSGQIDLFVANCTFADPTAAKMSMLIVRPSQFGTRTRNWLTKRASAAADPNRTSATGSFAVG